MTTNILEEHFISKSKAIVHYHEFLMKYKKGKSTIYLFFEGQEDITYYSNFIHRLYPEMELVQINSEGKENVLKIHSFFDWERFPKRQILFFVDRDFDYWCGVAQGDDYNIYVTEGYSFENDIVTKENYMRFLEELYGFCGAFENEKKSLEEVFDKYYDDFLENSYFFMATLVVSYKKTSKHLAKCVNPTDIIKVNERGVWRTERKGMPIKQFMLDKFSLEESDLGDIYSLCGRFQEDKEHYSVRGKWELVMLVQLMNYVCCEMGPSITPSLYKDGAVQPHPLLTLSKGQAASILGSRINIPERLVEFMRNIL